MLNIIIGFVIGTFFGLFIASLLVVASRNEVEDEP